MGQEERRQLEALYEKYLVPLKKLAVRFGIAYDSIDDMVHDTIMAFYDRYELTWNDRQSRAMLARILYTKWIDSYRKNSRYVKVSIDGEDKEFLLAEKFLERDALSQVMENERLREIKKQVEALKPDWKAVIILYTIDGRPISEVCEILGIAETVCRSRISRARQYLREKLKESGLFDF